MTGAVMSEDAGRSARLFSWCGVALIAAAVLMMVATVLHPSRETAATIIASEPRLVAAHVAYTFAWLLVLLGLPGLYAAQRGGMGRLGLAGFLTAFAGTYLIAVTGNFGFLAPVLAKQLHTLTVRLLQVDRRADAVAAAQEAIGRYGDAATLTGADRTKITQS